MDKNLSVAAFCKPATGKKLVCASGFRFCCFLHQTACFTDYAIPHLQGYYDEGLATGVVKIVRL